jgi:putative PIN family toxin of toxin-antitoxin system
MTRVVLDTNIVVSALISPFGNEAGVLHAIESGQITPCFSSKMLDEYSSVLARRKFAFTEYEIAGLMDLLKSQGLLIDPATVSRLSQDPKDDEFIACAAAAHADYLVTGNKRHFPQHACGSTKVVSSRELIEFLSKLRSP